MKYIYYFIGLALSIFCWPIILKAQSNKGINFQAIARNNSGLAIPNKLLNLRVSIKTDSNSSKNEYQETMPVTTNAL